MKCKKIVVSLCASLAMAAFSVTVAAQKAYPTKTVHLIVPFGAGSGTDIIARVVAEKLEQQMGVAVVVENKEGAGGVIGTTYVTKAAPDGYTLMMASNAVTIAPHLYAKAPYDPEKDLIPVTNVATMPLTLVTSANNDFKTLQDLFDYIKENPGKANFASSGLGSQSHLEVEALLRRYGLQAVHVPYKNTGMAATDTSSNTVTFYLPALPAVAGFVASGRLRALAIGSEERSPLAPDAPTFAEALGQQDIMPHAWFGFMVPKETPPEIVEQLNAEIVTAMESEEVKEKIRNVKADINVVESTEYGKQVVQESATWRELVKELELRNQ